MGAPVKDKGELTEFRPRDRPSSQQHEFVQQYLSNGRSAPLAYATVYAQNWKPGDPVTQAHSTAGYKYLKNAKVKKMLAEAEAKVKAVTVRVMDKYAVTQERVLEELARIAFTDQTDLVSWDKDGKVTVKESSELTDATKAAITEVVETKAGVRVKLADKQAALTTLAKHLGLLQEKPVSNNLAVQFVISKE